MLLGEAQLLRRKEIDMVKDVRVNEVLADAAVLTQQLGLEPPLWWKVLGQLLLLVRHELLPVTACRHVGCVSCLKKRVMSAARRRRRRRGSERTYSVAIC